jgi:hypothetical protein
MARSLPSRRIGKNPTKSAPDPFLPAVLSDPHADFKITDAQFADLERCGAVKLTDEHQGKLLTLALFWISDLRLRGSARPKQFRKVIDAMERTLGDAEAACDWDHGVKRHILHWATGTSIKDADLLPGTLTSLQGHLRTVRDKLVALDNCLPPDLGRRRPFDDDHRIMFLADIFEAAGGKASAYVPTYPEKGKWADTPFRRFAQSFYSLLPAQDKREPGGLDEALRLEVMARSASAVKSQA